MEKDTIREIADNLDFGMRCFIHSKTKEVKFVPDHDKHPDMDPTFFREDDEEIENNLMDYIEIEGMESFEVFNVMKDFIDTVDDDQLREALNRSLNRPKPFRNFKFTIDNSGPYRERWFKFKDQRLISRVESQLEANGF